MHYYIDVIKKYAVFTGRSRRSEFWYFTLFNFIISIIFSIITKLIGNGRNDIIGSLYSLGVCIPTLAVGIRRLHDIGKSGWMILISLIPIVGWIWLTVLACKDSQPGDNKYGPNPKGVPGTSASATPKENPANTEVPPQQSV